LDRPKGTVDILGACPTLARSRKVRELLAARFGVAQAKAAIKMMRTGALPGAFGDILHDFLLDAISNESKGVWYGLMPGSDDEYPITVYALGSIFFVSTTEWDEVGYFTSLRDAVDYVFREYEGTRQVTHF
jgi:hypothetical protein